MALDWSRAARLRQCAPPQAFLHLFTRRELP
jgi:hypothetical protein